MTARIPASASSSTSGRPLMVAFINPVNLFDEGNGAAQSLRTMLEQLAKRGAICHAFTACCFDIPPGELLSGKLGARGLSPSGKLQGFDIPVWQGNVAGVAYNVLQFRTQQRDQMTAAEELVFRDAALTWLETNRPDVVITFGGLLLDLELQRCAKVAGAALVFYLANPRYGRRETFAQADLILANSAATAEHYAQAMGLQCQNVGVFVDTGAVQAVQRLPPHLPQFVTFINPLPEKGVALFLKLVQRAAQEAQDMRFLVVESRGLLATAMQKLGLPANILAQTTVLPKQEQMAAVYAQTRILLVPSFWFEAAGRVLLEANANGIPVLASDRGGIPETLGGAGRLLPIPEQCTRDHWTMPTDAQVQPWWEELLTLWRADAYYEMCSRKARAVAETQTVQHKAAHLEQLLRSLVVDAGR